MTTKKTEPTGTLVGTGTDPLGRWPKGQAVVDPPDSDRLEQALEAGYLVRQADTDEIAEAKAATFEPTVEGRRELTDRGFTDAEAQAIDTHNRRTFVEARRRRFERHVTRGRRP